MGCVLHYPQSTLILQKTKLLPSHPPCLPGARHHWGHFMCVSKTPVNTAAGRRAPREVREVSSWLLSAHVPFREESGKCRCRLRAAPASLSLGTGFRDTSPVGLRCGATTWHPPPRTSPGSQSSPPASQQSPRVKAPETQP